MPYCELDFIFDAATIGTGPFRTGCEFFVPDTTDQMEDIMNCAADWWTAASTFKGYIASAMGGPILQAQGVFSGNVVEYQTARLGVPTGLAPELPGVSFRAVKSGNRPLGGRRGSMFWPGAENTAHDGDGVLQGSARVDLDAGLTTLLTDVEAEVTGAYFSQKHVVLGEESHSVVTDFSVENTVSFLQRRYR